MVRTINFSKKDTFYTFSKAIPPWNPGSGGFEKAALKLAKQMYAHKLAQTIPRIRSMSQKLCIFMVGFQGWASKGLLHYNMQTLEMNRADQSICLLMATKMRRK